MVMDEVSGEARHQGAGHLSISGESNLSMGLGYGNSIHAALAEANKTRAKVYPWAQFWEDLTLFICQATASQEEVL